MYNFEWSWHHQRFIFSYVPHTIQHSTVVESSLLVSFPANESENQFLAMSYPRSTPLYNASGARNSEICICFYKSLLEARGLVTSASIMTGTLHKACFFMTARPAHPKRLREDHPPVSETTYLGLIIEVTWSRKRSLGLYAVATDRLVL